MSGQICSAVFMALIDLEMSLPDKMSHVPLEGFRRRAMASTRRHVVAPRPNDGRQDNQSAPLLVVHQMGCPISMDSAVRRSTMVLSTTLRGGTRLFATRPQRRTSEVSPFASGFVRETWLACHATAVERDTRVSTIDLALDQCEALPCCAVAVCSGTSKSKPGQFLTTRESLGSTWSATIWELLAQVLGGDEPGSLRIVETCEGARWSRRIAANIRAPNTAMSDQNAKKKNAKMTGEPRAKQKAEDTTPPKKPNGQTGDAENALIPQNAKIAKSREMPKMKKIAKKCQPPAFPTLLFNKNRRKKKTCKKREKTKLPKRRKRPKKAKRWPKQEGRKAKGKRKKLEAMSHPTEARGSAPDVLNANCTAFNAQTNTACGGCRPQCCGISSSLLAFSSRTCCCEPSCTTAGQG